MTATHKTHRKREPAPVLYLSLELGWSSWKLASTIGPGQKPRVRSFRARSLGVLLGEIEAAKKRFGLSEKVRVVCCYEAGRDGFWLHRFLLAHGVESVVVDSASIEVNRRKRRAKSDRLDAIKLVSMLIRFCEGERTAWAARAKGQPRGPRVSPAGQGSALAGQGSALAGQGSALAGQGSAPRGQGSALAGQGSALAGQGSALVYSNFIGPVRRGPPRARAGGQP